MDWFKNEIWLHRAISFEPEPDNNWKLIYKLSEKCDEGDEISWRENGEPSETWATYFCQNVNEADSQRHAIVKIRMQIPYSGSLVLPAAMRAEQATRDVGFIAATERRALVQLTRAHCSSTPKLLGYKQTEQGDDGFVPGGYICFFLMNYLPGVSLKNGFWDLELAERDDIRTAFEAAYKECLRCGYIHSSAYPENLIWDKPNKKIYIVDWKTARSPRDFDGWENRVMLKWHLAETRAEDRNDMSKWRK